MHFMIVWLSLLPLTFSLQNLTSSEVWKGKSGDGVFEERQRDHTDYLGGGLGNAAGSETQLWPP